MMIKKITGRKKRQIRIRQRLAGTPVRPRLCVFMSNMHIYAQIIDDLAGKTLVAAGTVSKSMKETKINAKSAAAIGKQIAELAKHLKKHAKDSDSRRGLLMMVGKRRKLLNYLKKSDSKKYEKLIKDLGLKK